MVRPLGSLRLDMLVRQGVGRLRPPQCIEEHVEFAGGGQQEAGLQAIMVGQPALHLCKDLDGLTSIFRRVSTERVDVMSHPERGVRPLVTQEVMSFQ